MQFKIIFFILLIYFSFGLPNKSYSQQIKLSNSVTNFWNLKGTEFYNNSIKGKFKSYDHSELSYLVMNPKSQGEPIVLVPGMGESFLYYIELSYVLSNKYNGPIFILEHRGSGLNPRILPDPRMAHIDDFDIYINDFNIFIKEIAFKWLRKNKNNKAPFLIAHSMGAAIATLALSKDEKLSNEFKKIVFFSPMFGIDLTLKITPCILVNEIAIDLNGKLLTKITQIGIHSLAYLFPKKSVLGTKKYSEEYDPNNRVTSSEEHWHLLRILEKQFQQPLHIAYVSYNWLDQALSATEKIQKLNPKWNQPTLILLAGHDVIVQNSFAQEFATKLHIGEVDTIINSKHGIHLERNEFREQLINKILIFLDK